MKHGTISTYTNHKCRCDDCRAAAAAYQAAAVLRRAGYEPPTHGLSGYVNYVCRCDVCRAAKAANQRHYSARKQADKL